MSDNELQRLGRVADEAIAAFVFETAVSMGGVFDMGLNMTASALTKNVLGQDKKSRGVRVSYDEDRGYTIDVYLIAAYGANIPETAWNVQKGVYDGLKEKYGIEPEDINIHVQGVHMD
ncbi:MAG: Asp23/Gls24 family envelope stress response protein [Clostridiales bacterium]|nr:Asp23/Gls24 family envelope stress response protein [Clostridiales bacterium]